MLHLQMIEKLNTFLQNFFDLTYNPLDTKDNLNYRIIGTYKAINHRKNQSEEVKTLHLVGNFYVYIEVKFTRDYQNKFISVSLFEGAGNDEKKNQLFRAEWDDYENNNNANHPQPHWHITRDKAQELVFSDLANKNIEAESMSLEMFDFSNKSVFDTKKVHFAMSGLWHYNNEGHVHKMDDADKIVNWMRGLLEHVRYELNT